MRSAICIYLYVITKIFASLKLLCGNGINEKPGKTNFV